MALAPFRIESTGTTHRLFVHGEEVEGVQVLRVDLAGGSPPLISIRRHAEFEQALEGEGIVHVEVPVSGSAARDEVLAWLDSLDPKTLEAEALQRDTGWGDTTLAGTIIDVLRELAEAGL